MTGTTGTTNPTTGATFSETPPLEPIRTTRRVRFLEDEQLDRLQEATLHVLEDGRGPLPERALSGDPRRPRGYGRRGDPGRPVPAGPGPHGHGTGAARVHHGRPRPGLRPRSRRARPTTRPTAVGSRRSTRTPGSSDRSRRRTSRGWRGPPTGLPSIGFMWPTVSAQDMGLTSQLHEIDAAYNNTVKHFQGMVMGDEAARFAVEMATVVAGSREALRARPVCSNLICSVAPLAQDHAGLESALVMAEAGHPGGLPLDADPGHDGAVHVRRSPRRRRRGGHLGHRAAAARLPRRAGLPLDHEGMGGPPNRQLRGLLLDGRTRYAPVEMAHHWGVPSLAACFGTDSPSAGTWLAASDVALDPLLGALSGAELVTGHRPRSDVHAALP